MQRTEQAVRVLLCTAPAEKAEALAQALLERRLVACVNEIRGVVSRYRWQDALQKDTESLLVLKTDAARLDALARAVTELHPYDVPELLALPVEAGLGPYCDWVKTETLLPDAGA